jgi:oxygen-dependent protoporphyrinogen oxidase
MSRIAVIGGGIAGLTAADRVSATHDVVAFEREPVAGGKIRSQQIDDFLFEWGPSGFLSSAKDIQTLVADLGLSDALTAAQPAAKNRFIYWNGALHTLPAKPPQALRMSLLTPFGKARALAELIVGKRAAGADESVDAFMRRRFGREVAERLVAPAVLGISGGDAKATSVAALFPRLLAMEAERGSILRGLMAGPRTPAHLTTFAHGGMQRLTDRLAERLGARLRSGVAVSRIERSAETWRVTYEGGTTDVDGVIVATPAPAAADLLATLDAPLAERLREIPYAPMRVVGVAFRPSDVRASLDGFGFLAARGHGVRMLGAFYTSSIVPEHAPADTVYLRIFLGGATDPAIATLDADAVKQIVLDDLRTTLGITAAPIAHHDIVWPEAIPQYGLAHRSIVTAIEQRVAAHPGLVLTGNAYRGLGVGDTVRDALAAASHFTSAAD